MHMHAIVIAIRFLCSLCQPPAFIGHIVVMRCLPDSTCRGLTPHALLGYSGRSFSPGCVHVVNVKLLAQQWYGSQL